MNKLRQFIAALLVAALSLSGTAWADVVRSSPTVSGGSGGGGLTTGTTTVSSGTDGRVFFNNGGVLGENANLFFDDTANAEFLQLGAGTGPGALRLLEGSGGGSNYGALTVPATLGGNRTYSFPDSSTTIPIFSQLITFAGPTAARTVTFPDVAFTVAGLAVAQTFTALQIFDTASGDAAQFNDPITVGGANDAVNTITISGTSIKAEGTADAFESSLLFGDATADIDITAPGGATSYTLAALQLAQTFTEDQTIESADSITFGGTSAAFPDLGWNTTQTVDTLVLALGTTSRALVILENGDQSTDLAHAQATAPTVFIHSADATTAADHINFSHNQTDGVIDVGTGKIVMNDITQFPVGAVGAPSVVFSNSATSGFYSASANRFGASVNGTLVLEFTSTDEVDFLVDTYFTDSVHHTDGDTLGFGSAYDDASIHWSTTNTPDAWIFGVGAESNYLVLAEHADRATDWALAQQTNPTLVIQSADAASVTERLLFYHDGTNGVSDVGSGAQIRKVIGLTRDYIEDGAKDLTAGAATNVVEIGVPSNTATGGMVEYTVIADDDTEFQARSGRVFYQVVNKATAETCVVSGVDTLGPTANPTQVMDGSVIAASSSTLTYTWGADVTGTNTCMLTLNAASGLTENTLQIMYKITKTFGTGAITPQ